MIGNLTGGDDANSRDLGHVIYRMKMLGFNAIRLPFTFAALAKVWLPLTRPYPSFCSAVGQPGNLYRLLCSRKCFYTLL